MAPQNLANQACNLSSSKNQDITGAILSRPPHANSRCSPPIWLLTWWFVPPTRTISPHSNPLSCFICHLLHHLLQTPSTHLQLSHQWDSRSWNKPSASTGQILTFLHLCSASASKTYFLSNASPTKSSQGTVNSIKCSYKVTYSTPVPNLISG